MAATVSYGDRRAAGGLLGVDLRQLLRVYSDLHPTSAGAQSAWEEALDSVSESVVVSDAT